MQLQGRSYLGRYFRVELSSSSQNSKTRWVLLMLKELETIVETQKFATRVFRVEFSIHWVLEFWFINFWVSTTVSSSCNSTKTHRVFEFWKLELDSALQNRYLTTKSLYLYYWDAIWEIASRKLSALKLMILREGEEVNTLWT